MAHGRDGRAGFDRAQFQFAEGLFTMVCAVSGTQCILKAASAAGITVPESMLVRANEVIR
jgi:hypothetical protein